jgi:hypothetical protein
MGSVSFYRSATFHAAEAHQHLELIAIVHAWSGRARR